MGPNTNVQLILILKHSYKNQFTYLSVYTDIYNNGST
jgi:hypothetical protein